ncbi:predicted protein [Streptomyces filamentosus NRRL 15998]|uniref:Predicted protein n=1 Tax=Streptomyces filamentosus NRRL 15998 TaxID=457431 RepID=D6AE21_STRFL|nr:predicted protein [Streptomyces filamentosus NRRL 15998]
MCSPRRHGKQYQGFGVPFTRISGGQCGAAGRWAVGLPGSRRPRGYLRVHE